MFLSVFVTVILTCQHKQDDAECVALLEIMEIGADVIGEQGCHLTWAELRNLSKENLSLSWTVIKDRVVDYTELPSYYCALLNLKGFVRYMLEDESTAETIFRGLLEIDSENICTLGNLAVLCYRQSRLAEHREYECRLRKVVKRKSPLLRARAYFDRAHSIRHFEQDKRKFTYIPFIKKAVEIAKDVEEREKSEWLFDFGLALYRKDCQLIVGHGAEAALEAGFREAARCFYAVIQTNSSFPGNTALAWVFLGILLQNQRSRKFEVSLTEETQLHYLNALDCFNKALSLQPTHPIVLRRVGAEMVKLKEFERARTLLDASLKQEKSWFAYRHRGLLNLAVYEDGIRTKERHDSYLVEAQQDFESAIQVKQVHADFSDLGYVLYLRGNYHAALHQFSRAARSASDDNFNPAVTHRRWALCLRAIHEPTGASKQEEKAREVEIHLSRHANAIEEAFHGHGINCQGFECDLERFNYSGEERLGFVNILSEERHPLSPIGHPYMSLPNHHSVYKYDFFVSFSHIDHKWTLFFFRKLERELELKGCIRYRDYECGKAIAANISTSIRKSAKILVIISPDSLNDPWCKFEVQKSHAESLTRNHVSLIPIMLRMCKIPEEFELTTYIKCQDGQFSVDDWHRLSKSLLKKV
ncbi:uncharacterized protein [Apostichopus japonicus]|uniref:uncharacterized protein isoform X3 n=1 Tax=Stichopus japonicus TaxID=307972 RepID=UPI003AB11095